MIKYEDNYILYDENECFELALFSTIGNRSEQQDRVGYELRDRAGLIVLCDGMGGHDGGQLASNMAVETFVTAYRFWNADTSPQQFLFQTLEDIDRKISRLKHMDNSRMQAGSTASAVLLEEKKLSWASVGDSRIYVLRKDEFIQVTEDHNYKMVLDKKRKQGSITEEAYQAEMAKGNVLVSFVGINGIPYVENNASPLQLLGGDMVVLMSDGIYKLVSDIELKTILKQPCSMEEILKKMYAKTQKNAADKNMKQDNISIAIIKIR